MTSETALKNCQKELSEQPEKNYKIWKDNQNHPSLDFKTVGNKLPIYSVRVSIGWRACGVKKDDTIIWFWIGSHEDYNNLLKRL